MILDFIQELAELGEAGKLEQAGESTEPKEPGEPVERCHQTKLECFIYHLQVKNRGLNKAIRSAGFEHIIFLTITDVRNTDFSSGDRLKNLLGINLFHVSLNDMTLPSGLESFTAIDCPHIIFEHELPNLTLLHLQNNGFLRGTWWLEKSPLSTVVFRTTLVLDIRFIELSNRCAHYIGLKSLTLSDNFSKTSAYFLAFWYYLEYFQVGDEVFYLTNNQLQRATFNLALKESKSGIPDLARIPRFTIADLVSELNLNLTLNQPH